MQPFLQLLWRFGATIAAIATTAWITFHAVGHAVAHALGVPCP